MVDLIIVAVLKLAGSLFIFVNPIVLDYIIAYMDPSNQDPAWKGNLYTTLMFLSPMLESLVNNQYEYQVNLIAMRMKAVITSTVYAKSTLLSNDSKQTFSSGDIVNMIMVDTQRIVDFIITANILWAAPVQIVVGMYLLWQQLNIASLAGMAFMACVIPVNIFITNRIKTIQAKMMAVKDERSKLMDETLNGIKLIKLSAWETFFEQKICAFRNIETKHLKRYAITQAFMMFFFSSSSFFVS